MSEVSETPASESSSESNELEAQDLNSISTESADVSNGLDVEGAITEMFGEEPSEEDTGESTEEEEATEKKITELKKKLMLKVDGEEIEEEIDWNDEDRLKRALQKERAFDKRSQEFSSLQKQVGQFMGDLKDNPFSMLEKMGLKVEDLVMDYAQKAVEDSEKSPEQVAREKMELELSALKKEKEEFKKRQEASEMETMRNQHAAQIETDIKGALDSVDTILPKDNPSIVARVAQTMYLAMNNGYPDVKAADVIPLVEKQFKKDLQGMFDVFPEEVLESLVGKHNFDRVRKKRVKNRRVTTETARQAVKQTNSKNNGIKGEEPQEKTYKDMFDYRF